MANKSFKKLLWIYPNPIIFCNKFVHDFDVGSLCHIIFYYQAIYVTGTGMVMYI